MTECRGFSEAGFRHPSRLPPEIKGGERMKERKKESEMKERKFQLKPTFIHYKNKKISILHFQKAGYEKILKFLVKGLPWR